MWQNTLHKKLPSITAAGLQILAMACMLLDHLWATVVPGNDWMTCVGRLAFPIYAFSLVEGYAHTRSLSRYALRLLLFALISEIPFNLMCGGSIWYPIHQNVLWTFLLGLTLIHWNARGANLPLWRRILRGASSALLGFLAGTLTMVDYYGFGVLMILVFWFLRGRKWWCLAGQLLLLWYINTELMGGLVYKFQAFGRLWVIHQQSFALLALIPIWLYNGRQGCSRPWFQYFRYCFYPAHMLLLAALRGIL